MAAAQKVYDLIVIGAGAPRGPLLPHAVTLAGSGGLATARRAARYNQNVLLIERESYYGGTCVNVGCVPKKVMWYMAEEMHGVTNMRDYGFDVDPAELKGKWNYAEMRKKRIAYIERLRGIYRNNLERDKIEVLHGNARFIDKKRIRVGSHDVEGRNIVIAVGGTPTRPSIPGSELGATSDDLYGDNPHGPFAGNELPRRVVVVGAGYIALESASVLRALGVEVTLMYRHDLFLRSWDPSVSKTIAAALEKDGVNLRSCTHIDRVEKAPNGVLTVVVDSLPQHVECDALLWAIGRTPVTSELGLDTVGIKTDPTTKHIVVDEWHRTSVDDVYALGDVIGRKDLTPVAIAVGRRLAEKLFNDPKNEVEPFDYDLIPSVMFTHPCAGMIGLTTDEAIKKYGAHDIREYTTTFTPMAHAITEHKYIMTVKMLCQGDNEKIVGLHIVGTGADEMLQGFAVATRMGATRKDFNRTLAIHPTAAEDIVLLS